MIDNTPESQIEAETGAPRVVEPPRYRDDRYDRPNRLNQILAWVGIVAGVVFIVAVIFFSGFFLGAHSGGHRGWHHGGGHRGDAMMHRGGPPMFPMGPRGEFERPMPPFGPGGPNFEFPSQQPGAPSTTAPARP